MNPIVAPLAENRGDIVEYKDPGCAYCPATVRACRDGDPRERGPGFCPSKVDHATVQGSLAGYEDDFTNRVIRESSIADAEGYLTNTRVEGICAFAKRMGYGKIGLAVCISFLDVGHTMSAILESHGFTVASACCRNGGSPKESVGIADAQKVRPGQFESMCNPLGQADVLNNAGCEFNIILGLCVGHDSLFMRHSQGLVTTLVVKDRVLAHNPIGALYLADTLYSRVYGPLRPDKPAKKPKRSG